MKPINILLVEDNEGDIVLTMEALRDGKINNTVTVLRDGESAINFLENGILEDLPDLILLDINLPKKNGHQVLQFIKQTNRTRHMPVIMLTTSSSEADINSAYRNYANCFITKPIELADFIVAVLKIEDFWINLVQLPKTNT
ncbi:response regulator [Hydrotalea sp.]|uniref:response regulator n=1 Tax=Hydrotalea sp. TaxID=2881279 RepID=UPI002609B754|nr:response regulator [Hydrotalea sp.]